MSEWSLESPNSPTARAKAQARHPSVAEITRTLSSTFAGLPENVGK